MQKINIWFFMESIIVSPMPPWRKCLQHLCFMAHSQFSWRNLSRITKNVYNLRKNTAIPEQNKVQKKHKDETFMRIEGTWIHLKKRSLRKPSKFCYFDSSSSRKEVQERSDDSSSSVANPEPCHRILPNLSTKNMYPVRRFSILSSFRK